MEKGKKQRGTVTRRAFLLLSAGAVGMALHPGDATAETPDSGVLFSESSCQKGDRGDQRILIAYASRCGSTGGVAEAIGRTLCASGSAVDVRLVAQAKDLASYRAVIVGSAIRMGHWLPEAIDFVKENKTLLERIPTAYFLVCMTLKEDTQATRNEVRAYLDPVLRETPGVRPAAIGLFPGAVDFGKLSFFYRAILKAKGVQEGDFRNWPAVTAWATALSAVLGKGRGR